VCQANNIQELDILVIDAEAYDDVVVKSLDINTYTPELIIFEHKLLPLDRLHALDRMLISKGYERMIVWTDTAYVRGELLRDECLQHVQKALPSLMPSYDWTWGGGNWLYSFPPDLR
jgi:hypothetical protein